MRRRVVAACAVVLATVALAAPAGAAPGGRLSQLVTGEVTGTTSFDGSGCPQIHHFWRGTFASDDGRLGGALAIDLCVVLEGSFPASGTFSLTTSRGTITGTATTSILDPASLITVVVTGGTRSFSNISGTIAVDIDGFITAFGSFTADLTSDLRRGRASV